MSNVAEFQSAAMAIAAMSRLLHARDWVPATSGNFSVRLGNGDIAITSSGKDKGRLTGADVMRLDAAGRPLSELKPSAETGLHLQLYARDPNIGAVLHVHSLNAVLCSGLIPGGVHLQGLELLKAFPGVTSHTGELFVPVFANKQDIESLARDVESYMAGNGQGHAYLLAGHGLYTWGENLEACYHQLEALDHLLAYYLRRQEPEKKP